MTEKLPLERLLRVDPRDAGCEASLLDLDEYVELECADAEAAARFPGLAAHLRSCPACRVDHDGLLRRVREDGW